MAKKAQQESNGETNKSQAIRELLKANSKITAADAVAQLAEKGVVVSTGLFHVVKGKAIGRKKKRKKRESQAASVVESATVSRGDAVATILKLKSFAQSVGGLKTLKRLVDALAE
jgi:hypothetical protein